MKFGPVAIAFLILLWSSPVNSFNFENLCQIYMTVMQSKYGVSPGLTDYLECLRDPDKWHREFIAKVLDGSASSGGGGGGGGGGAGGAGSAEKQNTSEDVLVQMCQQSVTQSARFANSSYFHFMDMSVVRDGSFSTVSGRADVMNGDGELVPHDISCDVKADKVVDLRVRPG